MRWNSLEEMALVGYSDGRSYILAHATLSDVGSACSTRSSSSHARKDSRVADNDYYRQSQLDNNAASPPRNVLRDGYLLDISIILYKSRARTYLQWRC